MRKAVYRYFVDQGLLTEERTSPLSVDHYVRRVLIPECAVELIRRDLAIDRGQDPDQSTPHARAEAEDVCEQSRRFGAALHSTSDEMDQFAEEEEEEERVRAEEAEEQRREAKAKTKAKAKADKKRTAKARARMRDEGQADRPEPSSYDQASSSSAPDPGRQVPLRRPKRAPEANYARPAGEAAGAPVVSTSRGWDGDRVEERPIKKARRVKAPGEDGSRLPPVFSV